MDQPQQVRSGEELDLNKLQQYLGQQLPDVTGDLVVKQFPSGFSNLTYSVNLGEAQFVLRRPPFGANIKSAHDMGREFKILSALSKGYNKAPKPVLYCEDETVMGAPFYMMERLEGIILRAKMPKDMIPNAETMAGIARSWVDTFVELHEVDYQAVGLGDLGKPEGYVERQVTGWTKRYFKAKTDEVPNVEKAAFWLHDHLPVHRTTSLIHNDYKYDNVVLAADDWTKVIGVLDWEMSTIGDPLMDLGTSLGYWVNGNDPDWMKAISLSPTVLPGNPKRSEVVEWYANKRKVNVDNIVFYYVFGVLKIAVIVQQIYARYKAGHTQDPRFAKLNFAVAKLGDVAMQAIQKDKIDDLF